MIKRELVKTIVSGIKPGFINLIYGPRRVGKTVLLSQIQDAIHEKPLSFNGDTEEARSLLSTTSETQISQIVKNNNVIFIDEAQRIKNIMLFLKILIDKFPEKKVFVTGSSSLNLASGARESLTGRTKTYKLFPLSFSEFSVDHTRESGVYLLPEILVYGGYPYLLQVQNQEKQQYLKKITEDYLFRDILFGERLVSQDILLKLSILLAFQVGSEVSMNELSNKLGVEISTVSRYLNFLKESFVIFELSSFSNNLRTEVTRSKKYYFYDLGIRNSLCGQFVDLEMRNDVGSLWENFLILERMKKNQNENLLVDYFFWRNYAQAEVDFVEKTSSGLQAFEFKWKEKTVRTPKAFLDNYHVNLRVISKENFTDFIL